MSCLGYWCFAHSLSLSPTPSEHARVTLSLTRIRLFLRATYQGCDTRCMGHLCAHVLGRTLEPHSVDPQPITTPSFPPSCHDRSLYKHTYTAHATTDDCYYEHALVLTLRSWYVHMLLHLLLSACTKTTLIFIPHTPHISWMIKSTFLIVVRTYLQG